MPRAFTKVLIANRGEIAVRIMRTCHALGLETVAVFSDADANAPHVAAADVAVRIGPADARASYLSVEALIAAAQATGADAVHPGYGFLSEQPALARACLAAGLVFIGPHADVIAQLGSKQAAKRIAQAAGVPTVPGYHGAAQDLPTLRHEAQAIGLPLLVKASAGGGGKGMRVVRAWPEFDDAIERAAREAETAFGDGTLLLERYVDRPRHIEVQILGDCFGQVTHLWERECSLQRRHQKIIEEAPSPGLTAAQRTAITEAAVAIGRAVGYTNAGTVEFIVDAEGAFYFLEVNTRLQVEHPVTELTVGIDLVREQLRLAAGAPLPFTAPPPVRGHAIEARVCAEDPANDFLPTTGQLSALGWAAGDGVRVDAGIVAGATIGIHYDSMLAKVIAWGADRAEATTRLARALERSWLPGLVTNRAFLARVLRHPAFQDGALDTGFLLRHQASLAEPALDDAARTWAIAAAVVADSAARPGRLAPTVPRGWRNTPWAGERARWQLGESEHLTELRWRDEVQLDLAIDGLRRSWRLIEATATGLTLEDDRGIRRASPVAQDRMAWTVGFEGRAIVVHTVPRFVDGAGVAATGGLVAPMPGNVIKLLVEVGAQVEIGTPLVVLEAMKMEHTVRAHVAGTIAQLLVSVGDQVAQDQPLAVLLDAPG